MSAIPKKSACSSGFTLIELLMALLILTVGLLGLLQSVGVAYEHNARNRLRDEAVAIAEEQLNFMRSHPRLAGSATFTPFTTAVRSISGANKTFKVSREFKNLEGSAAVGKGINKLTVAVRWSFKNMTTSHEIYTLKKL